MTKPTKSLKNSFIFLETVFSIIILTTLLALFINLDVSKEQEHLNIQIIENHFLSQNYNEHFTIQSKQLTFIKNDDETYTLDVQEVVFNNSFVKLTQYEQ